MPLHPTSTSWLSPPSEQVYSSGGTSSLLLLPPIALVVLSAPSCALLPYLHLLALVIRPPVRNQFSSSAAAMSPQLCLTISTTTAESDKTRDTSSSDSRQSDSSDICVVNFQFPTSWEKNGKVFQTHSLESRPMQPTTSY